MREKFFLEQMNRLIKIYESETPIDDYWAYHNIGHINCFKDINNYLDKKAFDKKSMRKYLKKIIKNSTDIIKKFDEKYDYFKDIDIKMEKQDEKTYSINDGKNCFAYSMIAVINKKVYFNK